MGKTEIVILNTKEYSSLVPGPNVFFDEIGTICGKTGTCWFLELLPDSQSDNFFVRLWFSLNNEKNPNDMLEFSLDHFISPDLLENLVRRRGFEYAVPLSEAFRWADPKEQLVNMYSYLLAQIAEIKLEFEHAVDATFASEDSAVLLVSADIDGWKGEAKTTLSEVRPFVDLKPTKI